MSEPIKCPRCGTEGCPAAWKELNLRVGDPVLPITEATIDIACSLRSLDRGMAYLVELLGAKR